MLDTTTPPILDERKFYREWWLIALLALSALITMTALKWGQSPGQVIYDQFHRWQSAQASPQVVVVAIDNNTLDSLGGWPLDRHHYAQLLNLLARPAHQPRSIGFDLLFLDPSPSDALLAEQMRKHRVVLAAEQGRQPGEPNQRLPVLALREAASALAHINVHFESDGALRGVSCAKVRLTTSPSSSLGMSPRSSTATAATGGFCKSTPSPACLRSVCPMSCRATCR
jgi:CHASE2 domain-containing sensor protein